MATKWTFILPCVRVCRRKGNTFLVSWIQNVEFFLRHFKAFCNIDLADIISCLRGTSNKRNEKKS